jgi:translocator protein
MAPTGWRWYSRSMKTNMKLLQIVNILSFLAVIVVNTLASTLGINGRLTGAISDDLPNLFVPAGLTFSIWGVIYLLLLLFTIAQARGLFSAGQNGPEATRRIGWLFAFSSAANVAWLLLWHYGLVEVSVLAMAAILGSLLAVYVRLGTGRTRAGAAERWLFRVPFSVYLGWITVATIANVTAFLVKAGWNGFGLHPEVWAVAVIIVAALITVAVLATRRDAGYALVVLWALAGIALKRLADSSPASRAVFVAALACGGVVAAAIIASAVRSAVRPRRA